MAALEAQGLATVALVSEAFLPLAEAQAAALEFPDARLVSFTHPLAGLSEDAVREKAEGMIDHVIEAFLRPKS